MTTCVSPRFSMWRTLPTSVTIPVNMTSLLGLAREAFQKVDTKRAPADATETRGLLKGRRSYCRSGIAAARSQDKGRGEQFDRVDQSGFEKSCLDRSATFDKKSRDAASPKFSQHGSYVHTSARVAGGLYCLDAKL